MSTKHTQYEEILTKAPSNQKRTIAIVFVFVVLIAISLPFVSADKISERGITISSNILKNFLSIIVFLRLSFLPEPKYCETSIPAPVASPMQSE